MTASNNRDAARIAEHAAGAEQFGRSVALIFGHRRLADYVAGEFHGGAVSGDMLAVARASGMGAAHARIRASLRAVAGAGAAATVRD